MKTLEEYRYRKVPAVDVRRVTSFINNGIKEDELPESLKKKWQFAEYGKEKHLANKFLKTRKIKESVNEREMSIKDAYKDMVKDHGASKALDMLADVLAGGALAAMDDKAVKAFKKKLLKKMKESVNEDSEFTMKIDSYQNAMNALDKYVDVLKNLGLKKKSAAALKLLKNLQKIMFQKEIKEVSRPLVDKLYHAIDDVEELIDASNSDEADDAFEKLRPSKKALVASLKLLNKVK